MQAIPRPLVAEALDVSEDNLPEGDLPLDRFAERYLDFLRATFETEAFDAHPDYWTDLLLSALMARDPALALAALAATLAACEDADDLALVAAGPLEELLTEKGAELLPEIDALAARAERFRLALTQLWAEGGGAPLLVARVRGLTQNAELDEDGELPSPTGLDA